MEMGMLEITDCGGVEFDAIMLLGGIGFGKCGPNVTDLAGEAIASSESLKRLTLSGSVYQYSTKDDAIVKYWDITTESKFYDLLGHKDYVRCGDDSPVSDDMFGEVQNYLFDEVSESSNVCWRNWLFFNGGSFFDLSSDGEKEREWVNG
ncbi:hypothetical protein KY290_022057 [Solanum tuberosum]|uniref:Uncharacterized protein n=1 Tax=Solanum tuberosum TaxID=4113 RepID=A0ABQ7V3A4_SOLTU|nr:hypothetical protein KY289_021206 [Solanum tuberosum]KAH0758564.1 hypothetical protein KY290_022057 [Solanum tuberosum]